MFARKQTARRLGRTKNEQGKSPLVRFPILRIHRQLSTVIKKKTKSFLPTILRPNFESKARGEGRNPSRLKAQLLRGGRVSYIRPALPRANPDFFQDSFEAKENRENEPLFLRTQPRQPSRHFAQPSMSPRPASLHGTPHALASPIPQTMNRPIRTRSNRTVQSQPPNLRRPGFEPAGFKTSLLARCLGI